MSGSGLPLNAPANSPAVDENNYFETAWTAFFEQIAFDANAAAVAHNGTLTGETTADDLTVNGTLTVVGAAVFEATLVVGTNATISGNLAQTGEAAFGGDVGFFGTHPVGKQTVTGSKGGNAALANLLTVLASFGLIIDSST